MQSEGADDGGREAESGARGGCIVRLHVFSIEMALTTWGWNHRPVQSGMIEQGRGLDLKAFEGLWVLFDPTVYCRGVLTRLTRPS